MLKHELSDEWQSVLEASLNSDYMRDVKQRLMTDARDGHIIYPAPDQYFNALYQTNLPDIKVVIIGQDPYHGPNQAHGLSFSVPKGEKIPPSLRNIYKEIAQEYQVEMPEHGNLENWAQQGVLLLNTSLSVIAGKAGSHSKIGWQKFTDEILKQVNKNCNNIVFMLWGAHAQKKAELIDRERHLILEAPHPSPLSAHRGFLGCNHFKYANAYLEEHNVPQIDWLSL